MYGMTGSIPDKSFLREFVQSHMESLLDVIE